MEGVRAADLEKQKALSPQTIFSDNTFRDMRLLCQCIQYLKVMAWNAFLWGDAMAMLTVRNLPDEVHRALRVRAAQHGHSTEAEVREILANAVKPETRVRLGEALAALGRQIGLTNQDFEVFDRVSDKTPAEPLRFE